LHSKNVTIIIIYILTLTNTNDFCPAVATGHERSLNFQLEKPKGLSQFYLKRQNLIVIIESSDSESRYYVATIRQTKITS
jgi:hypothetical protein